MSDPNRTTVTITGIPVNINGTMSLVDALVSVDFALIAAQYAAMASLTRRRTSTLLLGAIVVKVINQRVAKL